jgi:hypothetical protein
VPWLAQQVLDQIDTGEYEYFDFEVLRPSCRLTVSVTALSGDPDIYITRNSSVRTHSGATRACSLTRGARDDRARRARATTSATP